ncbi:MAG TPA: sigma 54-interacting transcriptional regulator, partial [Bacillota bacterium]|nr:sigma 54-interacting transcriptional regulator [Bacillota bacterium]
YLNEIRRELPEARLELVSDDCTILISDTLPQNVGQSCMFANLPQYYKKLTEGKQLYVIFDMTFDMNLPNGICNGDNRMMLYPIMGYRQTYFGSIGILDVPKEELLRRNRFLRRIAFRLGLLHETMQLITSLVKGLDNYCLFCDGQNRILYVNDATEAMLGFDPRGQDYYSLFEGESTHNFPRMKDGYIVAFRTKSGPVKACLVQAQPLDVPDRPNFWMAAFKRVHPAAVYLPKRQKSDDPFAAIIGKTPEMLQIKATAARTARYPANVLLLGETGTGKDMLAEAIHKASGRPGNYVSINCGSIPKELIASELFGYEPGSFTGASRTGKIGKLEQANKGTILLNEIGDMPLDLQVNLLQFLETKQLTRVGGTIPKHLDVRVIAATHKNLRREVQKGTFREDLFFRLNVLSIELPPLRERKDDIPLLVKHFIHKICERNGLPAVYPDVRGMELLCEYDWPGNIRELSNVLEQMVLFSTSPEGATEFISRILKKETSKEILPPEQPLPQELAPAEEMEKNLLIRALNYERGIITRAARSLGWSRSTIYRKIKKYNLQPVDQEATLWTAR